MATNETASSQQEKKKAGGLVSNAVSGFATGLFSIPEGMAYAQIAGVNPVYGLYSGMVATLTAALTTGTILMISTLTSAIAIATASVIQYPVVGESTDDALDAAAQWLQSRSMPQDSGGNPDDKAG